MKHVDLFPYRALKLDSVVYHGLGLCPWYKTLRRKSRLFWPLEDVLLDPIVYGIRQQIIKCGFSLVSYEKMSDIGLRSLRVEQQLIKSYEKSVE